MTIIATTAWGPAVGGLAAGAIIGGAIANSKAQAAQNDAYCFQRFKSCDPTSGTYLDYDGQRRPCPNCHGLRQRHGTIHEYAQPIEDELNGN
ncbi:hypothetical protein V1279_006496 [Bradyrhizobium sp. AZCC 1610]|uniref:BA14K family protein n=1 Tax=Bradyrhizobium sp. AZCC 1610 TaxID=3117020 RepID=UPI002FF3131D